MMSDDLEKPYITKVNFKARFDEMGKQSAMLNGYLDALGRIMPDLKNRIETAQNFEELKTDLLNAVNGHLETLDFIEDEWDNDPEKYGLPDRGDQPDWF